MDQTGNQNHINPDDPPGDGMPGQNRDNRQDMERQQDQQRGERQTDKLSERDRETGNENHGGTGGVDQGHNQRR